jgi:uncharacterized protein (DUF433 family)
MFLTRMKGQFMVMTLTAYQVPLHIDQDGVIRIGKTRVTMDIVIRAFKRGASPETIAAQFPAITLAEAYGAVAYYLQHQAEIDDYLRKGEEEVAPINKMLQDMFNPVGTREKLLARLAEKKRDEQK